jgi:hypothetical protein
MVLRVRVGGVGHDAVVLAAPAGDWSHVGHRLAVSGRLRPAFADTAGTAISTLTCGNVMWRHRVERARLDSSSAGSGFESRMAHHL